MSWEQAMRDWRNAARDVVTAGSGPQMDAAMQDLARARESYELEVSMQQITLKRNPTSGTCRAEGCEQRPHARGLCQVHYNRAARACILDEVGLAVAHGGGPRTPPATVEQSAVAASTTPATVEQSAVAASTATSIPSPEARPPLSGESTPLEQVIMPKNKKILDVVPWDDVLHTIDTLAEAGWEKEAAIDLVAGLLDKALPLDTLVPGAAGAALEAVDGPVIRAAIGLLWTLAQDKTLREARKARRAA